MLGEIWIPPCGASSLAFQLTSSCSLKGHGKLPLCHSCSTNLSAHHLLSEPIPCLCLRPMPISEPLFWSLSLCFSLYVSCVCCPLCLSGHLFLCLHPCLCLCPFSLSLSLVFSCSAPSVPVGLSPLLTVSVSLPVCPSLCIYLQPQLCVSLPPSRLWHPFPLSASLSVFLSWSRPQPLAAMPPWPEPGAVLASAAPSRLPACPSSSRASSGQCGHPTPASQQPARRGRCSGDFRQEYLHATPGTENSLEPVSSPTP